MEWVISGYQVVVGRVKARAVELMLEICKKQKELKKVKLSRWKATD